MPAHSSNEYQREYLKKYRLKNNPERANFIAEYFDPITHCYIIPKADFDSGKIIFFKNPRLSKNV